MWVDAYKIGTFECYSFFLKKKIVLNSHGRKYIMLLNSITYGYILIVVFKMCLARCAFQGKFICILSKMQNYMDQTIVLAPQFTSSVRNSDGFLPLKKHPQNKQ